MTPPARSLPQATESVCPVCLRRIPAEYVLDPAEEGIPSVLLRKECPEHGVFSVPVWRGMPDFRSCLLYTSCCYMYGLFMAEVAVDITTGKTAVEKLTMIADIGKVNNRLVTDGQLYGGLAQGIGLAHGKQLKEFLP